MLNNEMQTVTVTSYKDILDDYGQPRSLVDSTRNVDMMIKLYSQTNVTDPRFIDITHIGITKDTGITTANTISTLSDNFNVAYIIPSSRYTQVFLKKIS